jgi:hypothetical protein
MVDHTPTNVIEKQKNLMTDHTIAEITTQNEMLTTECANEQHTCAGCVHSTVWESSDSTLSKHYQNLSLDNISAPFNIKHIYHVNPNCKYLKDKEFVGSMPPLVRTVSGPSKVKTKIKGKLSKADIGQPFDFIHVEGTRKMLNNVDEDHVADDSAEDAE